MSGPTRSTARQAGHHPLVEKGARLGYAANGLINVLIGWIALKLAWGIDGGPEDADSSGALATVANTSTGPLLLWMTVVGLGFLLILLLVVR